MGLILCWQLWGAWTGIDWNEFNSLSELERRLNLEHAEEGGRFSLLGFMEWRWESQQPKTEMWEESCRSTKCHRHHPISVQHRIHSFDLATFTRTMCTYMHTLIWTCSPLSENTCHFQCPDLYNMCVIVCFPRLLSWQEDNACHDATGS